MRFKDYYTNEKLLMEGGNVRIDGQQAQKIPMEKVDEKQFKKLKEELMLSFKGFNDAFKRKTKKPLWVDFKKLVSSSLIFSGSTRAFFQKPLKTFAKFKKQVGDMDLQIPEPYLKDMYDVLDKLKGKKVGNFKWFGHQRSGNQINGILETTKEWWPIVKYIQVDFEGTEFASDEPTEFATFGHFSSWTDITKNVKGLFVKYLFRSLVGAIDTQEFEVVTSKGTLSKAKQFTDKKKHGMLGFSVDKGLRAKFRPFLDEKGKIVKTNGLPTFQEIKKGDPDWKFTTDLGKIFELVFHRVPKGSERTDIRSFIKTLKIMKKYLKVQKIEEIFFKFIHLLWGRGQQGIERNNPQADKSIKMSAYKEFLKAFPYLKKNEKEVQKMIEDYYKSYRMT